jgi:hypothetical protein
MKYVILDQQSTLYNEALLFMSRGIIGSTTERSGRYVLMPMTRIPSGISAALPLMTTYANGGAFVSNRIFDNTLTADAAVIAAYVADQDWEALL